MAETALTIPRNLILVLGDQLNADSAAFDDCDFARDAVWMAEVTGEAAHVWSHKARIAVFLAAMRHFRDALRKTGATVHYTSLDDPDNRNSLASELRRAVQERKPRRLIVVKPGEWRVREELLAAAKAQDIELEIRPDRHFVCSAEEFAAHAEGRRRLRTEFFYREMRRKTHVLMEADHPVGERWNFDAENRGRFGKVGPGRIRAPASFSPDAVTREVLALVEKRFAKHPGSLKHFDWPVTPRQAKRALTDFVSHRLASFGEYQDAMWTGEPFLYHSRLSSSLNLKLLDPRDVIAAAERAYIQGNAALASVEGFIRQILGWREFVRGIYWRFMPEYLERNALKAERELPAFYWTADTDMACLREVIGQTLQYGYAHHIQRLMVTGLFALLLGVRPRAVHEWYLAVYVDAVEWVELPNTLGMSQSADGGIMASKPYVATGKYIQRMSNYCGHCRFDPKQSTGEAACPFTTLYWDFLLRHETWLGRNPRMKMQLRNLGRLDPGQRRRIRRQADRLKSKL